MRRYVPILVAGSALIAAACRDTIAPKSSPTESATLTWVGDRSFAAVAAEPDPNEQSVAFTLSPDGGVASFGAFTLTYDANAVCDPATSGYGPTTWKESCSTLATDLAMTAIFGTDSEGKEYVVFAPDIRFNPEKRVVLSVTRPEIVGAERSLSMYLDYNIWFFERIDSIDWFIDEAWLYEELRTNFDTVTGVVTRRTFHFSGFVIRQGECAGENPPPECEQGQ